MKTAIYEEDGKLQLVITPESEFEHQALGKIGKNIYEARLFSGSFYDCRGGWVSQNRYIPSEHRNLGNDWESKDKSLIINLTANKDNQDGKV